MNLRVQQLLVEVETKTQDNVFVKIKVAVQYRVAEVYKAHYTLDDAEEQIEAFVFDVVRAQVPQIKLDDLFEKKDEIANAVREQLAQIMDDFGYAILKAPVTDIDPDGTVKASMNAINAAQRNRLAASEQGEADRILQVKRAEGEAQSKALQGKGIADQRRAIVEGLRASIAEFQEAVQGSTAQDVMSLVMLTQYFDTIKEIGVGAGARAVFLPHSPGGLRDLASQVRDGVLAAVEGAK